MNQRTILFSVFLFLMLSYTATAQDMNIFSLDGKWQFRQAGKSEWLPASVPGAVHLDLLKNKIIPDPFFGNNESKLQWIGETGWEYKKTFEYGAEQFEWRHIDLVFKGLDTYANVYLNDSLVLVANNMFREWYIDAKRFLVIGTNTLKIQFPAVVPQTKAIYDQLPYKLPGDERTVIRKAAYHFGWDWGPTYITSGIWKSVYIRHWNHVNVLGVQYIQKSLTDSLAKLAAQFTIFSELGDSAEIRLYVDTVQILRQQVILNKGPNVIRGDFAIKDPKKWWPNGLGNQPLYHFGHRVYFNNTLVGEGRQRIGLRTVELIQNRDSIGQSFWFRVNGSPVFMKGANYIPQDNFPTRVTDSAYKALLWDARMANINMLRVWGGGIYERDAFYNYCDEYGIMVWQDFMFANAMYPDTKEFLDNVRDEAIQNIVRLRSHPSIAVWCGNNEIEEGWKNWGWQKQYGYTTEDSTKIFDNYRWIFRGILANNVRKFDTLRPYISTSPMHGWGKPESLKEGDSHYWGVWWGKEPFSTYEKKVGRFVSEYGFQSFPELSTIRKFTVPADRVLGSTVMKAHQKHPTGYEIIDEYLLRDFRKPKDFDSYVYVSQLVQALGLKTAIEAHRRAMPRCMGTLFWQYNDCWPVVSWSARDYYGKKKAIHYALPGAYDPMLISPVIENGRIKVYIANDDDQPYKAIMTVKVLDFNGNMYSDEGFDLWIPENSSLVYYDTLQSELLGKLDPRDVVILATLKGTAFVPLAVKNLLYLVPPKELNLPVPAINKTVTATNTGCTIKISSDKLVKNLQLYTILPGEFSDNYFDLLPGETVSIKFETGKKVPAIGEKIFIRSLVDSY